MRAPATARCWRRRKRSTSCGCATARISPAPRRRCATARRSRSAASRSRSIRPAMCSARRRSRVERDGMRIVASGDYKDAPDPTCAPFELVPCDVFITEATFGLPVFRHRDADGEIAKLLHSVALFPERAHLVGAYSLGKAQRVIALLRAGRLRQADLSARRDGEDHALLRAAAASISASCAPVRGAEQGRARRHHRALPAVGAAGRLDAALSRSGRRASPRAGCGCARARASAASSCRW